MDDGNLDSRPPPPPWMDKDFVQKALRAGEDDPELVVISYEISMANAVGDGYSSDFYRVIAKLQDSQERRVVVKCSPQGGKREELITKAGVFDIETRMLTKTLPAMYKLLTEARPGKYSPFSAKCLYYGNDPVQFIVLEDLRQSGFTLARRQQGVDLTHCSLAIRTLAHFHAASLAVLDQDPTVIQCYNKSVHNDDNKEEICVFFEKQLCVLAEEVSQWPGFENYGSKLQNLKETFYDRVIECSKRKDNKFNVLLHGDPWTSNMMFKYNGNIVEQMRLVDFQTCHYSCVALDLQYFLHTCPNEEVRIRHMDSLVREYHSTLLETLEVLGVPGHTISLAELNKSLEDCASFGLMAAVSVLPIVLSKPEDEFDLEGALSQSDDSDKAIRKLYSNPTYIKAFKHMLPLFDEYGSLDT